MITVTNIVIIGFISVFVLRQFTFRLPTPTPDTRPVPAPIRFCARHIKDFVFVLHRCLDTGLTTQNHVVFNCILTVPGQFRRVLCILDQYISESAICDHIVLL